MCGCPGNHIPRWTRPHSGCSLLFILVATTGSAVTIHRHTTAVPTKPSTTLTQANISSGQSAFARYRTLLGLAINPVQEDGSSSPLPVGFLKLSKPTFQARQTTMASTTTPKTPDQRHIDPSAPNQITTQSQLAQPTSTVPSASVLQRISCMVASSTASGVCLNYDQAESVCWDQDMAESPDCLSNQQVCCTERASQLSLDDRPCGTTGSSIRSPRRLRLVPDPVTKDICWMAFISLLRSTGEREYVCDAVILNSSHILTPSECVMKMRKSIIAAPVKKLTVTIGQPVGAFRQSLDFSQTRCGQEYSLDQAAIIADNLLTTLLHKGFAAFRVNGGEIQPDRCTCRVCLPRESDRHLAISSRCYVSGFVNAAESGKTKKATVNLDLLAYRTNLISPAMCRVLLSPQKLPSEQVETIVSKLICSVSSDVAGYCVGGMGGSLTCTDEDDKQHYLVGLSVQPVDCYSAPRLFRNIIGCRDSIHDTGTPCEAASVALTSDRSQQCGRPKTNISADLFGLSAQTKQGTAKRAINIGRRMQMLSSFPVADAVLGRSGSDFGNSETFQPGLHVSHDPEGLDICWTVAVFNPNKGHCSGVLLSSRFVLTAAHCATEQDGSTVRDVSPFRVFVGFDSIPRDAERDCERVHRVKRLLVHPLYSKPSGSRFFDINDLALVELQEPIELENNECACVICLDGHTAPSPGELCTLSGFGCPAPIFANEACPAPRPWSLTWANVIVLGEETCAAIPHFARDAMACSVTDGGPSGCYGDSGGPLVCYDKTMERHYLTGVFSFILSTTGATPQRCRTQPLLPNFYTKVTNYLPWLIESVPGLEIALE